MPQVLFECLQGGEQTGEPVTRFLVLPDPDTELQDGHKDVLQVCSYRMSGTRPDIRFSSYPASSNIRLDEYLSDPA